MRKGGQNRTGYLGPVTREAPDIFFRLCHHCLYLNEADQEISRCAKCEAEFLPAEANSSHGFQDLDEDLEELAGDHNIVTLKDADDSDDEEMHDFEEGNPPHKRPKLAGLNVKW